MTDPLRSPDLRAWHLDPSALVYVRRSTPQQVSDHQESTARQYALAGRAVALGWSSDRITTIDDDLGRRGQSTEGRPGFQRLLADVALDHVGLILGPDMSRLARPNRDRHQRLEPCARFRVPLADAGAIYDPADHNDGLSLGPHGMMSEAGLHAPKGRTYQGKLNKARRGALMGAPPVGYLRLGSGDRAVDPDDQVRATARLIFDQFDRGTTLHGLVRYLVRHGAKVPVRSDSGPDRGGLEWRRPDRATPSNPLHHPSHAGAYRLGRRPVGPRRKRPGRPTTGKLIRRPEECLVLIRDRLPASIPWDRSQADQDRLDANRVRPLRPADDRPVSGAEGSPRLRLYPRFGRPCRAAPPGPVGAGARRPDHRAGPGGRRAGGPGGEPGGGGRLTRSSTNPGPRRRPRRRAWRRWPGSSGTGPTWPGTGGCAESGRPRGSIARPGNTRRASRRIAWSDESRSAAGRSR
jgi:DNA invertase Pin-like site-specific DNA recombinase